MSVRKGPASATRTPAPAPAPAPATTTSPAPAKPRTRPAAAAAAGTASPAGTTGTATTSTTPAKPKSTPIRSSSSVARTDQLQEETKQMEQRLQMLRIAMAKEREQREAIPKDKKHGTFWKSARPREGKDYIQDIYDKRDRLNAKHAAMTANGTTSTVTAASTPTSTTLSSSASTSTLLAKSSYTPPVRPKITPATLMHSSSQSTLSARGKTPDGTHDYTSTWMKETNVAANNTTSTSDNDMMQSLPDENINAAPGSLLDGVFDEQAGRQSFLEARQAFLKDVYDGDVDTSITTSSESTLPPSDSLLNGPMFDEKESAQSFQDARRAWLESMGQTSTTTITHATSTPAKKVIIVRADEMPSAAATAPGEWNVTAAQSGTISDMLFPSLIDPDEIRPSTSTSTSTSNPTTNTHLIDELVSHEKQEKRSCYQCYKLFYATKGYYDSSFDKLFCTSECCDGYAKNNKISCQARISNACMRTFYKVDGMNIPGQNKLVCKACATYDPSQPQPERPTTGVSRPTTASTNIPTATTATSAGTPTNATSTVSTTSTTNLEDDDEEEPVPRSLQVTPSRPLHQPVKPSAPKQTESVRPTSGYAVRPTSATSTCTTTSLPTPSTATAPSSSSSMPAPAPAAAPAPSAPVTPIVTFPDDD